MKTHFHSNKFIRRKWLDSVLFHRFTFFDVYISSTYITGQKKEKEEEEEEEEEAFNDTPYVPESVDVEALISKNGDSPTLDLSMERLKCPDMKIIADTLRNNTVK
jgi:hypothetical protein